MLILSVRLSEMMKLSDFSSFNHVTFIIVTIDIIISQLQHAFKGPFLTYSLIGSLHLSKSYKYITI